MCEKRDGLGREVNPSGAEALEEREGLIAVLKALRHPKAWHGAGNAADIVGAETDGPSTPLALPFGKDKFRSG